MRVRLPGVVLPGFANAHSHAFHRALRGRTHLGGGSFWTWREQMYALAARLDPDSYLELATAVYAEMALAGVTCVGEFHYVHHQPDGTPYAEPNAMGDALREAARRAGIRLTAARHVLPRRRHRRAAAAGAAPLQRRRRAGVGGPGARSHARRGAPTRRPGSVSRCTRCAPCRSRRSMIVGGAREWIGAGRAAARPRQRAAGRERGLPRGVRPDAGRAARRPRAARAVDHRRARHPPHAGRHPPARRRRRVGLLLPDHRARPGRRDRPGAGAARRRRAADAGLRPARGDRPARGGARARDARAAGHPRARPVRARPS